MAVIIFFLWVSMMLDQDNMDSTCQHSVQFSVFKVSTMRASSNWTAPHPLDNMHPF
jgi:hypothetical protein